MDSNVMVSVCCTAYNHEKYIRKCLDGFVMQQANFKYEVLINDDASTDHTADIIREYEKKYPDIIKPIYQTENQYSIDRNITFNILYPKVKGRYIALCEGDDFWTDPLKLQKQVDAMEANPQCTMCVGKAEIISEDGENVLGEYPSNVGDREIITSKRFLEIVLNEDLFQTSTYLFRSDLCKAYMNNSPYFQQISPVGDIPSVLFFGQMGNVYYIPDKMSCYREASIGSWTQTVWQSDERRKEHFQEMIEVYKEFDKYTDYKYHYFCEKRIFRHAYAIAETKEDFEKLKNSDVFSKQSARQKARIYLGAYCPSLLKMYYKVTG